MVALTKMMRIRKFRKGTPPDRASKTKNQFFHSF
jgi:hypothetical protein